MNMQTFYLQYNVNKPLASMAIMKLCPYSKLERKLDTHVLSKSSFSTVVLYIKVAIARRKLENVLYFQNVCRYILITVLTFNSIAILLRRSLLCLHGILKSYEN